jgi:hypothetical protein
MDAEQAWQALKTLLETRIDEAQAGKDPRRRETRGERL